MLKWIVIAAAVTPLTATAAGAPGSANAAIIGMFQAICQAERPNFSRIDARANAMGMGVEDDQTTPASNGAVTKHKTWTGNLKTGPVGLMLDGVSGPLGTSTSCAVFGAAGDPNAFRDALIRTLNLPAPGAPKLEAGSRAFEWADAVGPGTTLIVRDLTPSGKPGIMVKLISAEARPAPPPP